MTKAKAIATGKLEGFEVKRRRMTSSKSSSNLKRSNSYRIENRTEKRDRSESPSFGKKQEQDDINVDMSTKDTATNKNSMSEVKEDLTEEEK